MVESPKCTDNSKVFVSGLYTPSVVCIFLMSHCVRAKQIVPPSTIFLARRFSFQQITVSAFDFSIKFISFANPGLPGLFALIDSCITSITSSHSAFAISRQKSSWLSRDRACFSVPSVLFRTYMTAFDIIFLFYPRHHEFHSREYFNPLSGFGFYFLQTRRSWHCIKTSFRQTQFYQVASPL